MLVFNKKSKLYTLVPIFDFFWDYVFK